MQAKPKTFNEALFILVGSALMVQSPVVCGWARSLWKLEGRPSYGRLLFLLVWCWVRLNAGFAIAFFAAACPIWYGCQELLGVSKTWAGILAVVTFHAAFGVLVLEPARRHGELATAEDAKKRFAAKSSNNE